MRRRGFIGTLGACVVGAAAPAGAEPAGRTEAAAAGGTVTVVLNVNGEPQRLQVESRWTLLHALRVGLGLTGAKPGCERGECGACTVLVDGTARYACLTLVQEAEGREITTVEGLLRGRELGPVQRAFVEEDGMQCGYCTPGQVMAAEGLLRRVPDPSVEEIRQAMSGNLCRCGAYHHICKSVERAARLRKDQG